MKESFKELIERVIKKRDFYDSTIKDVKGLSNIENVDDCKRFIRAIIDAKGKRGASLCKELDNLDDYRVRHIVSVYLFGLAVYNGSTSLKMHIDSQMNEFKNIILQYEDNPFPFIWMLVCLFHDLGYPYKHEYETWEAMLDSIEPVTEGDNDKSLDKCTGVPEIYNGIHENYFEYISKTRKSSDHGICAGYKLYNDCCRIRSEKARDNNRNGWKHELVSVYNYVAWIISCHNIWTVSEGDESVDKYHGFGLDKLILKDGDYPISSVEHPVFFLFCLVDTIEPIKVVRDTSLLENIVVEISDNEISYEVQLKCSCRDTLMKRAGGLKDWLTKASCTDNVAKISL
ncbi:MAG: hypothetical protein MJZ60_05800 [Bacteroidaceae bacterium]|nr:hypothetical protein [Bacteroidaceae bacterium]